jgi:hypothetical protein
MLPVLVFEEDCDQLCDIEIAIKEIGFKDIISAGTMVSAYRITDHQNTCLAVLSVDIMCRQDYSMVLQFIRHLRKVQPQCRIIAICPQTISSLVADLFNCGADDYISIAWNKINWKALLQQRILLWFGLLQSINSVSHESVVVGTM